MCVAILMALYELAKETIFKGQLTLWESHTITVIVTATFATITAQFIRARTNTLNKELQEAHTQAADVIDNMLDGVIMIDKEGVIVKFNPAAEKIFQRPFNKAIGKHFKVLLDISYANEFQDKIQSISEDNETLAFHNSKREVIGVRSNGEKFPMDLITSSMIIGGELMFLGMVRDTSDSKKAEEEIERLRQVEKKIHESLKNEVTIAGAIQMNMIPKGGNLYPEHTRIRAHGFTRPAKEMGGDFFDAFSIDSDHIALAIGDVSGKGVPAALFMMKIMTLLRSNITKSTGLIESIRVVNNALCQNNDSNMFVTMFIGILNVTTGEMQYINAGHDAPLTANTNQEFTPLSGPRNMILGIHEVNSFNVGTTTLNTGDTLLLYTDGVTEAESIEGQLYSINRVSRLLSNSQMTSEEIVNKLLTDIDLHCQSTPQSDDITLLAIQYH
ncbi:PP2C family protein-serine/threonine phosphatase [Polynucleobacter sp. UB-Tiil-W10]|uniref:PP2C family protein-serine/threonine phosphatase n=1 Tax=Polynucleobacter sp. UB-Tiil-W10 TaxID=1855648 RepID=UPI001C0DA13B|nr:SpoIIE family protein phosphatase [Polynucleobacter sp. UB-Tiil-W10]MBU3541059.1 SpoIIE family protein phosphatase [Polynucleobacter sp. UB-Tiil-W10]